MKHTLKNRFDALEVNAKEGFINNLIAIANKHAEMSSTLKVNVLNSLLLLNWGAIVAMAAFLAAVKHPSINAKYFQITLVFFAHTVGIFGALAAKVLAAWYADEKSIEYRKYLRDAVIGESTLVWDKLDSNQGGKILVAGFVVFSIGTMAFCIGLGVAISLVVALTAI